MRATERPASIQLNPRIAVNVRLMQREESEKGELGGTRKVKRDGDDYKHDFRSVWVQIE